MYNKNQTYKWFLKNFIQLQIEGNLVKSYLMLPTKNQE